MQQPEFKDSTFKWSRIKKLLNDFLLDDDSKHYNTLNSIPINLQHSLLRFIKLIYF